MTAHSHTAPSKMTLRALAAGLLLAAPLVAAAAPGSDLDRLSGTDDILGAAPVPQEPAEADPPGPPTDTDPVPLDGGLSLLALAGAGYAAKRLRARRA